MRAQRRAIYRNIKRYILSEYRWYRRILNGLRYWNPPAEKDFLKLGKKKINRGPGRIDHDDWFVNDKQHKDHKVREKLHFEELDEAEEALEEIVVLEENENIS